MEITEDIKKELKDEAEFLLFKLKRDHAAFVEENHLAFSLRWSFAGYVIACTTGPDEALRQIKGPDRGFEILLDPGDAVEDVIQAINRGLFRMNTSGGSHPPKSHTLGHEGVVDIDDSRIGFGHYNPYDPLSED